MPTTTDGTIAEILAAVDIELRAAVAAEDAVLALSILPRHEAAFRRAMAASADFQNTFAEASTLLQLCLCMVRAQRQEALDQYSRLFDADSFRVEPRPVGTWDLEG